MRKTFGKYIVRTSALTLACFALSALQAKAGVLQTYSTSGAIFGDGITSSDGTPVTTPPISFNPVVSGSFTAPSAVSLGEFVVSTLPDGQTVNYNNVKFTETFNPVSIAGTPYAADVTPVTITGVLNGSVTGNQSSVQATFDPITSPSFASADKMYLSTLSVLNNPLNLVPASAGGRTTEQAGVITTTPVPAGDTTATPEPTTFAILATAMVGLGLRHRLRSGRKVA